MKISEASRDIFFDGRDFSELAILVSGGLDSAILLAEALRLCRKVHPLYIRGGLLWEMAELDHLRQFLHELRCPALKPLQLLDMPLADLYGSHWSLTGLGVPDSRSADDEVFLPGRNTLLLAKSMVWCHVHGVPAVALAPLESNPFPDATPAFFAAYEGAVNQGIGSSVQVLRPYAGLHKVDVLNRGRKLPLHLTFSCIRPLAGKHCGRCNKCAERQRAFAAAGIPDQTEYCNQQSASAKADC